MTTTAPTTKIVIVSGQEFSVPADATIEDLRAHLAGMFPDVAAATVQKGKKKIDGVEYETIEFVKKVGTKGASTTDLIAALASIPAQRLSPPADATTHLLDAVRTGRATIAQALDAQIVTVIAALPRRGGQTGGTLCSKLDAIPPVGGRGPSVW